MNYQLFSQNELAHITPEMAQAKQDLFDRLVSSVNWRCSKNIYKAFRPYNFVYWLSPNSRAFFRRIVYKNKGDGLNGEVFAIYQWKHNGKKWYICVLHKYNNPLCDDFARATWFGSKQDKMLTCIKFTFNQLVIYDNFYDTKKWISKNFSDIEFENVYVPARAPPLCQDRDEPVFLRYDDLDDGF